MTHTIIGREAELKTLKMIYRSQYAEFVAVYGRRRVGKTYLIKNFLKSQKGQYFQITGIKDASLLTQLERFSLDLSRAFYEGAPLKVPTSWIDAFEMLNTAIERVKKSQKILMFFDELPWLATSKSGLLEALEYFWNRYWSDDSRIKLVVCGSSASWIIKKIIKNRGGLHNRVTRKMRLKPFTFSEVQAFMSFHGIKLNMIDCLRVYQVFGGIPFYLKLLEKRKSVDQNINMICFEQDSALTEEFNDVFASLFTNAQAYKELILLVGSAVSGTPRTVIENKNKLTGKGGTLSERLDDLEDAGFISSYLPVGKMKKGVLYRLSDEFCAFYIKWLQPIIHQVKRGSIAEYWQSVRQTPSYYNWAGYAFENICYKHLNLIKARLGVPLSSLAAPWRYIPVGSDEKGAQLDLVVESPDAFYMCEMKYTQNPFEVTKSYAKHIEQKIESFRHKESKDKQIIFVLISAKGIKENMYSEALVDHVVALTDLF